MIECGEYSLIFNGYIAKNPEDLLAGTNTEWIWGLQLYFSFTIPDDGNCIQLW